MPVFAYSNISSNQDEMISATETTNEVDHQNPNNTTSTATINSENRAELGARLLRLQLILRNLVNRHENNIDGQDRINSNSSLGGSAGWLLLHSFRVCLLFQDEVVDVLNDGDSSTSSVASKFLGWGLTLFFILFMFRIQQDNTPEVKKIINHRVWFILTVLVVKIYRLKIFGEDKKV